LTANFAGARVSSSKGQDGRCDISLGIAFKGPEGIVLAADSRVTLTVPIQPIQPQLGQSKPQAMLLPATYDNATKLLKVSGQDYVGAVTYGLGAIGQQAPRTAHSFVPEFEEELVKAQVGRLSVHDFAIRLSDFFSRQWQQSGMPQTSNYSGPDMVFLVGGYDVKEPYGALFEFHIPRNPSPSEWHKDNFGIVWGGQKEFTDRLIQGFDDELPKLAQQFLGLSDSQRDGLKAHLKSNLEAKIPFPFLPLQDCVDLSIMLIRTTIAIQNWIIGIRGVGGAIDVATITRTGKFEPIQRKKITGERLVQLF